MDDDSPSSFDLGVDAQYQGDATGARVTPKPPPFPFETAFDAVMAGQDHPGYSDPLVRPWIDMMTPRRIGPGLLDGGMRLLEEQSQADTSSAGPTQDAVSRFGPQAINGVPGLNFRVMTLDETGASSTGARDVVTGSLSRLPPTVLTDLRDKGVRWIVVPDSADQGLPNANLTTQQAQGWPDKKDPGNPASRLDWGDVSSTTVSPRSARPERNSVIIGTNNPGGDNSYNVTLHETGHAHDYNSGMPSASPAFRAAYGADVPNMTTPEEATPDNPSDGYYLKLPIDSSDDRGREEAYAEGFARYYGGDDTLQRDWPAMYQYWQRFDAGQRNARRKK